LGRHQRIIRDQLGDKTVCPGKSVQTVDRLGRNGCVIERRVALDQISNFPYLVPPSLTIWQTAAAPATQVFMLMGTLVLLPIILGYMVFNYWMFAGKLGEGEGYH
jgi:Cytochrome bd terminal oxidase subunit II